MYYTNMFVSFLSLSLGPFLQMVKFGQYLKHNIVPEWRDKVFASLHDDEQFIDYKGLKKIIKRFNEKGISRYGT